MSPATLARRVQNKWRRYSINSWGRRDFALRTDVPYVSFTFDDFPLSAFETGGRILTDHGAAGTYFVSFQMLGGPSPSGPIASAADLPALVAAGHELGCHTFEHLDGTHSSPEAFERSIRENGAALDAAFANRTFSVFAYPLEGPVLSIKRAVGTHFRCCRGGGQRVNEGVIDLNLLMGYFLDWKNNGDLDAIRQIIDENAASRGWLIFATHDVAREPSRYGCDPAYFENVVRLAVESGARVLSIGRVCDEIGVPVR
jgi:peptidoglycan/xylan/chitin deacetylase (PgdA/CDA1 family)